MTDREMLEAAAKAAGYWSREFNCPDKLPRPEWNPLTSDGDALRLAVKLGISMTQEPAHGSVYCDVVETRIAAEEEYGDDALAATRRAIVRAAAAIGRKM